MTTEERLAAIEAKLAGYERLIERLMVVAAQSPVGRQVLKKMGKVDV
jgi:uncharacterized coiled-coil protein SlyX